MKRNRKNVILAFQSLVVVFMTFAWPALSDSLKGIAESLVEQQVQSDNQFKTTGSTPTQIKANKSNTLQISQNFEQCMKKADGVTLDMLNCISTEHEIQDRRLNQIYKEVMTSLSSENQAKLKQEQREWIKNRDAECKERSIKFEGGSLEQVAYSDCIRELTEKRANEIKSSQAWSQPNETIQPSLHLNASALWLL
jgi:uncharacterized protein YecT (DUF1311 family)